MLPEKEGSQPRRFRYEAGYLLFVSCAKKLVSYTKKLVSCAKKTVSCAKKIVSKKKKKNKEHMLLGIHSFVLVAEVRLERATSRL